MVISLTSGFGTSLSFCPFCKLSRLLYMWQNVICASHTDFPDHVSFSIHNTFMVKLEKFYVVILCDLRQKRRLGRQGDTAQQETINNLISKTSVQRKASFAYTSYLLQLKDQSLWLGLPMLLCCFQHRPTNGLQYLWQQEMLT